MYPSRALRTILSFAVAMTMLVQLTGCDSNQSDIPSDNTPDITISPIEDTTTTTLTAKENDPTERIVVTSTLNEYSIGLDKTEIPAGEIVFAVSNVGKLVHEMVVLKSDHTLSKLPIENKEAVETGPGIVHVGEIEDIQPGGSGKLVLSLKPGYYHLLCNIPEHYQQGMYADLIVQ